MNIKNRQLVLLFYILLTVFFLRYLIISYGSIGLRDDWSIAYTAEQIKTQGYEHLYLWYPDNLGQPSLYPADTIFWLAEYLFGSLGFSGGLFSKLVLVISIALSGYVMYSLLADLRFDSTIASFCGVLYMFTPIMFNSIISGYFSYILSYMLFPIILLFFFRVCRNNFKFDKNLIILSVLNGISAIHIQFIVINSFIFVTYILYHHFVMRRFSLYNLLSSGFIFYSIFILINSFWIIPLVTINTSDLITEKQQSWIFLNNPDLLNSFAMDGGGYTYHSDTLRFSGYYMYWMINYFVLLILAFIALYGKKNKFVVYFSMILVSVLFIYKGQNAPFGELSRSIYVGTILGSIFRNVQYFAVILATSIIFMLSFSLTKIKNFLGNKFMLFIMLIYLLPWYSGDLNEQINIFELDENYSAMNTFIENHPGDYRVLYLPMSNIVEYKKAKFTQFQKKRHRSYGLVYGLNPIVYSSEKSTLGNAYKEGDAVDLLDKELHSYKGKNLSKKLGLMNIKYIIFTTEFESKMQYFMGPEFSKKYNWSNDNIKKTLENQSNILFIQNISDKIQIYKNVDFYPHIYGNPDNYSRMSFRKINPTKYKIDIESVKGPFYLIFSESFNPEWYTYISTDMMRCDPIVTYEYMNLTECRDRTKFLELEDLTQMFDIYIPKERHILVNNYTNVWYIDPKELGIDKDFSIILYFRPQSYFYLGFIISILTFVGCIGYIIWKKFKGDHI